MASDVTPLLQIDDGIRKPIRRGSVKGYYIRVFVLVDEVESRPRDPTFPSYGVVRVMRCLAPPITFLQIYEQRSDVHCFLCVEFNNMLIYFGAEVAMRIYRTK